MSIPEIAPCYRCKRPPAVTPSDLGGIIIYCPICAADVKNPLPSCFVRGKDRAAVAQKWVSLQILRQLEES